MERRTHIVFAAGAAAALARLLGLGPWGMVLLVSCAAVGAQVPDLDVGYRHRMLLHNLFAALPLALLYPLLLALGVPRAAAVAVAAGLLVGYASHLLLDAVTVAGVALLYPFSRRRLRLARLRSGSRLANMFFSVVGLLLLFYGLLWYLAPTRGG